MSCTTLLVGKSASYDGSTIIARNDDSGSGTYDPKKFVAVRPEDQPRHYRSVISHMEIDLPDDPCLYSIVPNVRPNRGVLAEAGVNEYNVAMSATETIAVNSRVLAADPLVKLVPAHGEPGDADYREEVPGGFGEEDIITLVLPYVRTAREAVARIGELLATYGTYESNGIIASDVDEIWYVETIGGHHWIARRVPDDCYAAIPNQLGIDLLDIDDAMSECRNNMCSADLADFIEANHLDRAMPDPEFADHTAQHVNPRTVFGTATPKDAIYNTPRLVHAAVSQPERRLGFVGRAVPPGFAGHAVGARAGEQSDHRRRRVPDGLAFGARRSTRTARPARRNPGTATVRSA